MGDRSRSRRRVVLGGLGAVLTGAATAVPPEPEPSALMIAGPPGGRLDRWADILVPALNRGLAGRVPLARRNVGGIDGVTGANQFEALGEPDGSTALLVPGAAALSWLTGEMRARFDPGRWVPLWAGFGSAVLFSRAPLSAGRPVRMAGSGPAGLELPALLALDLLGIDVVLSAQASADAVFVANPSPAGAATSDMRAEWQPVMSLGVLGEDGGIGRDPGFPAIPTAQEMVRNRGPDELLAALRAACVASQLDAGLVLPALTPASAVSVWRRACAGLLSDPTVVQEAARTRSRLASPELVAYCTSSLVGNATTLLTLRRWLASRYAWRPT